MSDKTFNSFLYIVYPFLCYKQNLLSQFHHSAFLIRLNFLLHKSPSVAIRIIQIYSFYYSKIITEYTSKILNLFFLIITKLL